MEVLSLEVVCSFPNISILQVSKRHERLVNVQIAQAVSKQPGDGVNDSVRTHRRKCCSRLY